MGSSGMEMGVGGHSAYTSHWIQDDIRKVGWFLYLNLTFMLCSCILVTLSFQRKRSRVCQKEPNFFVEHIKFPVDATIIFNVFICMRSFTNIVTITSFGEVKKWGQLNSITVFVSFLCFSCDKFLSQTLIFFVINLMKCYQFYFIQKIVENWYDFPWFYLLSFPRLSTVFDYFFFRLSSWWMVAQCYFGTLPFDSFGFKNLTRKIKSSKFEVWPFNLIHFPPDFFFLPICLSTFSMKNTNEIETKKNSYWFIQSFDIQANHMVEWHRFYVKSQP